MVADSMLLPSIAYFGAAALGVGIVAVAVAGLWRAMTDERPLLLAQLLDRESVDMGPRLTGVGARQFALAARRCMRCAARERCEEWLSQGRRSGYQAFCPNTAYIARLKD
jgi:hypothetical protein